MGPKVNPGGGAAGPVPPPRGKREGGGRGLAAAGAGIRGGGARGVGGERAGGMEERYSKAETLALRRKHIG